jgi:hypothetical protein
MLNGAMSRTSASATDDPSRAAGEVLLMRDVAIRYVALDGFEQVHRLSLLEMFSV